MARFYYGSKISDNITKLDNGCLVCFNVPIARTGIYKYLRSELGMDGNGIVDVYRDPKEVFDPVTIASFEGKAFVDTHPAVDVTSDNWSQYAKGTITNVRRGKGDEAEVKREVSAVYECEYVEKEGKIFQTKIRGNHVALVQTGRAGNQVRINDEKFEDGVFPKTKASVTPKYRTIKKLEKLIRTI